MTTYGDFAGLVLQGLGIGVRQESLIGLWWPGWGPSRASTARTATPPTMPQHNPARARCHRLQLGRREELSLPQRRRAGHCDHNPEWALPSRHHGSAGGSEDLAHAVGPRRRGTPDFTGLTATVRGRLCEVCFHPPVRVAGRAVSDWSRTHVQPPIAVVALCAFEHRTLGPPPPPSPRAGAVFCSPPTPTSGANGRKFFWAAPPPSSRLTLAATAHRHSGRTLHLPHGCPVGDGRHARSWRTPATVRLRPYVHRRRHERHGRVSPSTLPWTAGELRRRPKAKLPEYVWWSIGFTSALTYRLRSHRPLVVAHVGRPHGRVHVLGVRPCTQPGRRQRVEGVDVKCQTPTPSPG